MMATAVGRRSPHPMLREKKKRRLMSKVNYDALSVQAFRRFRTCHTQCWSHNGVRECTIEEGTRGGRVVAVCFEYCGRNSLVRLKEIANAKMMLLLQVNVAANHCELYGGHPRLMELDT